jgi:hypothetical protein
MHSTVSPWIAERTLLAVASEPELLAAVPGKRAHVEMQEQQDHRRRSASRRRAAAAVARAPRALTPSPNRSQGDLVPVHEIESLREERASLFEQMKEINDTRRRRVP